MGKLLRFALIAAAFTLAFPSSRADASTKLVFDADLKEVNAKVGELNAEFDFSVTNTATTNITIRSVHASCGCTTPKMPALPWELAAGTNGSFHVTVDLRGKAGTFQKSVTMDTSEGIRVVNVKINMPSDVVAAPGMDSRTRNQMIAQADRQAIFRGDCAGCHTPPSTMKGEQLFTSTCAICHESEHRATAVPDLHALKQTPNATYWEAWVRYGKVGTMMPAFGTEHGGPLSDEQISSLVTYLSKDFPSRPPKGATTAPVATPSTKVPSPFQSRPAALRTPPAAPAVAPPASN